MPYQVLARKYRPLRFADVAGQDHVTRTLQNALEQGRVAHGYIFSGHRGIGKTTIARILASALNCQNAIGSAQRPTPEPCLQCDSCREIRQGNAVDVIEIDAATNRGIDEIRELRDAARYRPARDRFKIYILDEAHQITDAAFNALLKTLEEPPEHIVFMMATTEPENIPQTIRSRCQHFSFHAVKLDDILAQLRKIAADEHVIADDAALDLLAEAGDGSMRDALSIMDQAIASAPLVDGKPQLSATEIRDLMGSVPNTVFEEILEHVSANQAAGVLTTANRLLDAGNSPAQIARQFVRYLRNCVVASIANLTPDSADTELLQISPDERRRAARSAMLFTEEELTRFMQVMLRTFDDLGFRQEQRFHLELGLLKLVHLQRLLPMEHFLSQLPRPAGQRRTAPPTTSARPANTGVGAPGSAQAAGASGANSASTPSTPAASGVAAPAAPVASPFPAQPARSSAGPSPTAEPVVLPRQAASPVRPFVDRGESASSAPPSVVAGRSNAPQRTSPPPDAEDLRKPAPAVGSSGTPVVPAQLSPLIAPGAKISPDPGIGLDPSLPPIDDYEVDAASVPDAAPQAPPPPPPDPEAQPSSPEPSDAAGMQAAAVEALFAAGSQNSAAEQLEETTWTIAEGEVRIQTSLSKPLMNTIFRADTQAIIRGAVASRGGAGLKLILLPGSVADKPKVAKKPRTGSAQARALEHPTVQAAQRLFNAEVTNVFDLRKD